ncbi:MAG TPA: TolC family protein [Vicinamibacterales bacterium]|nr:TolC family protein [Vicinamibacterales bacterium]
MVAALALALTASVSAQQTPPPSGSQPQGLPQQQQPTGSATSANITAIAQYVVGQATPPVTQGVPVKELTLDDAIQIALEKNLDLQVAKMNPLIQDYNLVQARAAYKPTLTGTFNQNRASSQSTSRLDGVVSLNINQAQQYNLGVNQRVQWYGGTFGVSFNNGRTYSNSSNSIFNPSYSSSLRLNYTQPLFQNLKIDSNRNALRTTVIQRQISDVALQSTIENTKANVRTAYWALRQAIERIEIQRLSLLLAQQVVADNKVKVEIGTMAPIDQTTAEVQEAQSEQALLNAQVQWTTAELALKRLIVAGPEDELYRSTLNPTTRPGFELQNVDIPSAIQNATAQRTDIVQQRQNLDISNLNLEVSKDATKPQLDMTGSYQLAGTGGLSKDQSGNYFDALYALGTLNTPTWTLGLNFNYPIGMAAARASLARAEIQRNQAVQGIKVTELQIATDVTNAGLAVQNSWLQLQAAQKSRQAAEKNAAAEQTRFDVGMSNPYNVATALNNLTNARLGELQAIVNYVNAVAEFDRIQRVGR